MAPTATVRASTATRDRLWGLAEREGWSMAALLEAGGRDLKEAAVWDEVDAAFEVDVAASDATLRDGLEDDPCDK